MDFALTNSKNIVHSSRESSDSSANRNTLFSPFSLPFFIQSDTPTFKQYYSESPEVSKTGIIVVINLSGSTPVYSSIHWFLYNLV